MIRIWMQCLIIITILNLLIRMPLQIEASSRKRVPIHKHNTIVQQVESEQKSKTSHSHTIAPYERQTDKENKETDKQSVPSYYPTDGPTKVPIRSPSKSPSTTPTSDPSVSASRYPSWFPTNSPTWSPTNSPTLVKSQYPSISFSPTVQSSSNPTRKTKFDDNLKPSSSPTFASSHAPSALIDKEFDGVLMATFSVYGEFENSDMLVLANDATYLNATITGTIKCLCNQLSDFQILSATNGSDLCESYTTNLITHAHHNVMFIGERVDTVAKVVFKTVKISSIFDSEFTYSTAQVEFDVLKSRDDLQLEISNAISEWISSDSNLLLKEMAAIDSRISAVSESGKEKATFFDSEGDIAEVISDDGIYENLKPAPLHGLRVAGIMLLILTSFVSYFLFSTASRNKAEKELEMDRFKAMAGGLATEQDVNKFLDVARPAAMSK